MVFRAQLAVSPATGAGKRQQGQKWYLLRPLHAGCGDGRPLVCPSCTRKESHGRGTSSLVLSRKCTDFSQHPTLEAELCIGEG